MSSLDCDVLVVGGGPTGIALGLLLARNGVHTLIVDKEADIYPLPRAAHIDHETVRIFQSLGLAAAVLAASRPAGRYDFLNAAGDVLLRFDGTDRIGPGGWPGANMVHQPSLEAALRSAVRAQPSLRLETSATWLSFESLADGIVSRIRTPSGESRVRSTYIVGCDGARSSIRAAAGIELDDLKFDEPWLVTDAIVHDAERLPKINLQIFDPARPTTCVLMGSGRHRWEFMLKPGEPPEKMLDDAVIAKLLAPWNVDGAVTLERKAVYRFNAKVARQWRKGAVLLAGDAAHLMPPFAGQGLCSGLRDVANLGWKLAAVVRGADDCLLDTYQPEREPHVRAIINLAIMMGRTVCITDPEAAKARDAQMLAARAAGSAPDGSMQFPPISSGCISAGGGGYFPQPIARNERLDDVLGEGAWLISRDQASSHPSLTCVALDAPPLAPFRARLDAWLAEHRCDAVLVRPDRYVFGVGAADDLQQAWARWTT